VRNILPHATGPGKVSKDPAAVLYYFVIKIMRTAPASLFYRWNRGVLRISSRLLNTREGDRMLSKCDNPSSIGLWSSGVPLRRDIPVSMPSPATDPGFNRFPAGRDGGTTFPRPHKRPWG
jgi:hypothetical protein